MSKAFLCEVCEADPMWRVGRIGDAAVTWACAEHLSAVADGMQRDWEVTRLTLILSSKAEEWASIEAALDAVAEESP
jgi:hypothetical protein